MTPTCKSLYGSLRRDLIFAHRRTSAVTVKFLTEFKEIISNTTSDLNEHLQAIDTKLHALFLQGPRLSDKDAVERRRIQEEKDSAQQCLSICTQVYTHIDQVQSSSAFESISTPQDSYQASLNTLSSPASARMFTTESLKICKETMADSSVWLKRHLQDLNGRLIALPSQSAQMSNDHAAEQERIQEEIESIK